MQKAWFTIESFTVQNPKTGENIPSPSGKETWTVEDIKFSTLDVGERRMALPERLLFFTGKQGEVGPQPAKVVEKAEAPKAEETPKAETKKGKGGRKSTPVTVTPGKDEEGPSEAELQEIEAETAA